MASLHLAPQSLGFTAVRPMPRSRSLCGAAAGAPQLSNPRWQSTLRLSACSPPAKIFGVNSRQGSTPSDRGSRSAALPTWINPEAPEPFLFFNTAVLVPWMLMIIAPRWKVTRTLLEPTWFMVPYALIDTVYFFATAVLDAQAGKDVNAELVFLFTEAITDPEKMLSLFNNPAYAAQDWVHLCTWDMLAGRWIWLDSLSTGVPVRFALLTAFNSGPPGLLIYLVSRGLFQKPEDADSQVNKV